MNKEDENLLALYKQHPWLYTGKYWELAVNEYVDWVNRRILSKEKTKMLPLVTKDMYNTDILAKYKDSFTGISNYYVSETASILACVFQPSYDVLFCAHPFLSENDNSATSIRMFATSPSVVFDFMDENKKLILDDKRHFGFK